MAYGGRNNAAELARQQETERQNRIAQGRQAIDENLAGFDDSFYDRRAKEYEAYALPQFNEQAQTTRNQLAASLARRGLLNSGAAVQQQAGLERYATGQQQNIANAAIDEANKARTEVEGQRSQLTSQLLASGDPSTASAGALTAASTLRRPTAFGALGNFFTDWVDNFRANQVAQSVDKNVSPMFSFGGGNKSSVSYVP